MLKVSEHTVATAAGDRVAMVVTPTEHVRIGRADVPRQPDTMSKTDELILREAEARVPRVQLCIFRGMTEEGSWRFDDHLDETDCRALARRLLPGQILIYRAMLRAGLMMFVHTEWGVREADAYKYAVRTKIEDLGGLSSGGTTGLGQSNDALDMWLLRNLTFFFTLSFDKFVETVLPDKLAMMDKRMDRIRRMLNLPRP